MTEPLLTAEEFERQKPDLPDVGRWVELEDGRIVSLDPPSEAHGNAVLNLSKLLAVQIQTLPLEESGYACFEMGVIVSRNPDVVRFPAISYFVGHERFAEADQLLTKRVPILVIEIVSTKVRRRGISRRIEEFHTHGVQHVWIADPVDQLVHVCNRGSSPVSITAGETLSGEPPFPGLSTVVADLFAAPDWWLGTKKRRSG